MVRLIKLCQVVALALILLISTSSSGRVYRVCIRYLIVFICYHSFSFPFSQNDKNCIGFFAVCLYSRYGVIYSKMIQIKFIYRKLYHFIEKGCSKLNAVMLSDQSQSFCENVMKKCETKKIVIVEIPHTLCFDKKKNQQNY